MFDAWLPWAIVLVAVAAAVLVLLTRSPRSTGFANPREEQLARTLARVVSCAPAQALPAVRRELDLAPHASDETLIKRAAYHYRQELDEPSCPVYRDKARG